MGELPPFSPILNKLMATLAAEDVSFAKLAELIEKDTVLAGNVLRMVNSALYGRRGAINSVRHAVSLMGLVKLRNSVMSLSISRIWSGARTPKGWSGAQFNLHAVATAVMCDLLAQRGPIAYPEGGFVSGLLHDLGLLLIAISLPVEYEAIRQLHEEGGMSIADAEMEVIGLDHSEISAAALADWNLPEPIQKAVRYRRQPERQTAELVPLSRALQLAEQLVDCRGIPVLPHGQPVEDQTAEMIASLGFEIALGQLLDDFDREFEPMRSFF